MFAEPFCLENDGLLDEDPNCNFAYYARSFIESIKSNIENDIKILHYCHGPHIAKILIISALKSLRERDILKSNLRDSILTGKKAYWNKMKVYLLYNEYAELEKAFVCNKSLIQYRADFLKPNSLSSAFPLRGTLKVDIIIDSIIPLEERDWASAHNSLYCLMGSFSVCIHSKVMRLVSVNKRFNYYFQYSSVLRNGPLGGMTGAPN